VQVVDAENPLDVSEILRSPPAWKNTPPDTAEKLRQTNNSESDRHEDEYTSLILPLARNFKLY
jgi:hypothetical protein